MSRFSWKTGPGSAALGSERYERSEDRRGYRNGHETRKITTELGPQTLQVPRGRIADADGKTREFHSAVVPRYTRRTRKVDEAILGAYLAGANTRRIRKALEPLLGSEQLSKSAVSRGSRSSSPSGAGAICHRSVTRSCSWMASTSRCGWRVAW